MKTPITALCTALTAAALGTSAYAASTITIATVNNGDMVRMQRLVDDFTAKNPDIEVEWVTLEENALRQRVTQDIATGSGQFDVVTIGQYEAPIWAKQGWLEPIENMPGNFDRDDLMPSIADGLSVDGKLFASPFYAESAMVMYRTDLAEKAGVTIPERPTWSQIRTAAEAMTDRDAGIYGICLRGKAGWGENMAFMTAMANSYGAAWFNQNWEPQLTSAEWTAAVNDYLDLMENYGPTGASSNGFNENLTLFQQGKCGIWIDATVAASFVTDPKESTVAENVGYAVFPNKEGVDNHGNWLWAWSLAIPSSSDAKDAAKKFVSWATNREYTELVAAKEGWRSAPPGTRVSLYETAAYTEAAPFANMTLSAMKAATPNAPSVQDVPYRGGQFVAIVEFQGIGTAVGQQISAALAGQIDGESALSRSQTLAEREMKRAGYIK